MATMPLSLSPSRTTCASLLRELQLIWDEIGDTENERDKMLLQLEQECLAIYQKKVEFTRKHRDQLHKSLADVEAEITYLVSALGGENDAFSWGTGSLKDQISVLKPIVEDLRLKKKERVEEFSGIQSQIAQICGEIAGNGDQSKNEAIQVSGTDLTVKKLEELKLHLKELLHEKDLRIKKVNSQLAEIHELSVVMSIDFSKTVSEIHQSLSDHMKGFSKSISNETLARLTCVINTLKHEKQKRLHKLQDLCHKLMELWNLMDTPSNERQRFDHATSLISASVDNLSKQGCLALEILGQIELEVERLNTLKASKIRELVFKKQVELEEIYRGVHIDVDSDAARQILNNLIDSGNVDVSDLLSSMDEQIAKAKEQALSRKDILEKVEKWKFVTEEEKWLDDYERDGNRYSAGRGAHKNLKRAEKARILISKIPSIVESLTTRIKAWESEMGISFLYEKVSLLNMLEEYNALRQEREEGKRKSREQKRLQEQLATEKEALFGSRPAAKKPLGVSNTMVGTPIGRHAATPHGISAGKELRGSGRLNNITPINYVSLQKDDLIPRGS